MRIGLIGAGRIGGMHAILLDEQPGVDEVVVADVDPARAVAVAETLTKGVAVGIEAVLDGVDAIAIASSTDTHADYLVAAAAAGLPTFCEKPIALDLDSTRRAIEAVDAAGISVLMGFQRRYDPAMRAIRDRIASSGNGVPYLVRSQTHDPEPPPIDYLKVSGGIFRDCLIHDIDIVRYVTGQEVTSVRAAGTATGFPEIGEVGDVASATAILEMSGGTLAQLSGIRHDPVGYDVRLEVFTPDAAMSAGWGDGAPIVSLEPGAAAPTNPFTNFWDRFDAAYKAELAAFVAMVDGGAEPAATHHDAYADLQVAAACDISLREGRTVYLSEVV